VCQDVASLRWFQTNLFAPTAFASGHSSPSFGGSFSYLNGCFFSFHFTWQDGIYVFRMINIRFSTRLGYPRRKFCSKLSSLCTHLLLLKYLLVRFSVASIPTKANSAFLLASAHEQRSNRAVHDWWRYQRITCRRTSVTRMRTTRRSIRVCKNAVR